MTGVFSPGTFVELNDGSVGMVIRSHADHVLRPVIRLILDTEKRELSGERELDLSAEPVSARIVRALDPEGLPVDPHAYWRSARVDGV
jgi:hypothetical protein